MKFSLGDGVDDKSARRVADVLKREAGDESEAAPITRLQHADVAWIDDPERFDHVMETAGVGREVDVVVRLEVFQAAKEGIAMRRDPDIAAPARQRSAGNMSHGAR